MRLLPLLLLLLACAGPAEYQRGSPVPTRPPYNPTTDSPITTGQPGHLVPHALPRSPHQRQLPPPGKHPGLWGAEAPHASRERTSYPKVLGIDMVMADRENPAETLAAGVCVSAIKEALEAVPAGVVEALTADERKCAAALVYAACINEAMMATDRNAAAAPRQVADLERASRVATAAALAACDGSGGPRTQAVYGPVFQNLRAWFRSSP